MVIKKTRKKRGQSTLEYLLLVTAVIAVIIVFLVGSNSPFQSAFNSTLGTGTSQMTNLAGRLGNSYQ